MGKYEDLERLKKLQEAGSITEAEFEAEKQKILNSADTQNIKTKKGRAKVFVILTVVGIILTIFCTIGYFYYNDLWGKERYSKNNTVRFKYEDGLITEREYKNKTKKEQEYKRIYNIAKNVALGTGTLTVIFFITGVTLKIKEKGGIKIVD